MKQTCKQTVKYDFSFIGHNQIPLFMITAEDWVGDNCVYATPVFTINTPQWIQKLVWQKLGWAGIV